MVVNDVQSLFSASLDELELTKKQKAVLRASLQLFAKKGFADTSTREIAELAGVAEGTVYKQFKTKEGILAAIITPFIQQVVPKAATEFLVSIEQSASLNLEQFLRTIIINRLTFVSDNLPQLRIFIQQALTKPELLQQFGKMLTSLIAGPLGKQLQKYQKTGELVNLSLTRIVQYIITTILGYGLAAILADQPLEIKKASDEAVVFLLHGLKK